MKVAWVEDILSLVPPVAFLLSTRVRDRRANGVLAAAAMRVPVPGRGEGTYFLSVPGDDAIEALEGDRAEWSGESYVGVTEEKGG